MRDLIPLATIGVLAVALTACGKQNPATQNPDGAGGTGGAEGGAPISPSAPTDANPTPEVSKEAKADFEEAVKAYAAAKAKGQLSGDACERLAAGFQKVYKTHGVSMALAQFNSGAVWEECGQADKAAGIYTELISQAPKFDLAYNNLGVIYWRKGQDSKALDIFKKGVEANKLSAKAARNNVAALLRNTYVGNSDMNAFSEAEKSVQGVLALDSNNQAAYENLARTYYDRGHHQDTSYLVLANLVVTQGLRVLKESGKESAEIYNIQGLLLLERDNQVDALRTFKEALRIEPNHVEANLNIGFISIRFRDYATAEQAFETALKDPRQAKNVEAHLALGVARRGLKKFKEAEESYNQALRLNASDPRPFFNLGVLYQDHISTQDDVDSKRNEELIHVAKGHYNKFIAAAGGDPRWKHQVLLAQDRIATIEYSCDLGDLSAELLKKAQEMEALQRKQDEAESERLLELERQVLEAQAAEEAALAAPPAAPLAT